MKRTTGAVKVAIQSLRGLFNVVMVVMISLPVLAAPKRVQEVAPSIDWKEGSPKYSDVGMRSISKLDGTTKMRDKDGNDVYPNAITASKDFHISQLTWSYADPSNPSHKAFITNFTTRGIPFYLSNKLNVSGPTGLGMETISGSSATRPMDGLLFGCRNKDSFRSFALENGKKQIDNIPIANGTTVFALQQDDSSSQEAASNYVGIDHKGCFCSACSLKFSQNCSGNTYTDNTGITLTVSTTVLKGLKLGLHGETADRDDVKAFKAFARDTDEDYIKSLKNGLTSYFNMKRPGCNLLFSCNGPAHREGSLVNQIEQHYDYWMSEIYSNNHKQEWFWQVKNYSTSYRKKVMTTSNMVFSKQKFRHIIAGNYALGLNYIVPWDMYVASSTPSLRLYSTKEDYADLYGFIRGISGYLDGYEDAFGSGGINAGVIVDSRTLTDYSGTPPVKVTVGGDWLYAFTRAKPGNFNAPVVVHLVDWDNIPITSTISLSISRLFPDKQLTVKLLTPKPYNEAEHDAAEATKDYGSLVNSVGLSIGWLGGDEATVTVPALNPWGVLVVAPAAINPPKNIRVDAVTPWTVSLSFDPNDNPAGTEYIVNVSSDGWRTYSTMWRGASLTPLITGLKPGTSYSLRMRAVTSGSGLTWSARPDIPFATPAAATDTTPPTIPTLSAVGGSHSLGLSWTTSTDTGGSGLARYRVDVALDAGFTTFVAGWQNKDVGVLTSATVTGLGDYTNYSVRVRAEDNASNPSGFSNAVTTRTLDTMAPTISLSTPTAGTTYTTPQSVPVKATATDAVEVAKVWFLRNNVVVSTDTASPYEFSWAITGANNGAHTWKATAFDAMGNSSTTVAVPVTVNIDITPPAVTLTTPTAGTTYTTPQSVPVKATATDAVEVAKVWFLRNNVVVSTDTASPYEYSWPITGANNGAHSWKATAFDAMGNSSSTVAVPVTVNIDITPPAVALTTPTAGTTYTTPQSVPVKATATDAVGVAKVWFIRNDVVVSTDTASPYEYSWPITGANNGAHSWKATAFDAMGNSSTTVAVPVTVNIDITPPAVALTTPTAGTTYTTPQSVLVKATATDAVGVAKVWFLRNNVVVSTDTASPYEYSWPITGANNGAHSWKATAFDAMGNSSSTVAVPVTVNIDITPPAVALSTPTAGTIYTTPQSVPVKATATDAVGVTKVWFILNDVVVSTDTVSPYQYSWPITGANNGAHTWKATAFDTMGNSSTTVAVPVTVNIDITPPAVALTTPTAGTIYTTPQSVPVKATATDSVGVTKVWFILNDVVVSTDTVSPYQYSWPITGANNGAYAWKSTAFDAMGNSSTTVAVPVTVNIDILPPSTPVLQSPTELSATSVRLNWSAATDNVRVIGYRLYRNTFLIATIGGEETSFLDSGLAPETLYKYTVAAFDDMGNTSAMSPELSVTTPRRALLAPRGSLSGVSPQSVGIRWASVEGASRYTLAASLSVTSGHEFSLQREIPASEASDNESISGLSPNTTYYLYLNACNESDCTDFVPLGSAVTHALAPALTAAEGKGKEVRLTINANGNPAGTKYRIEMSRGGEEFTLATTATSLSPVMGDLAPGERYTFRVKAENHAGVTTEPSNTLSATIAPETVEGARAYPVPFRPGIGAEGITFDQIPEGSSVKIYTADGRPVKTLSTDTAGKVLWTLDNEEGSSVVSGVYMAVIEKAGAKKKIKLLVQK